MFANRMKLIMCVLMILVLLFPFGCTDEMAEEIKQKISEEVSTELEKVKEDISSEISDRKDKAVDDVKLGIDNLFSRIVEDIKEWFGGLFRRSIQPKPEPGDPDPLPDITPAEIVQREVNQMNDEHFNIWKYETGWNAQTGWPPTPALTNISKFTSPQEVDSFYGISAMVRNKLYLGDVGEAEGRYACAEYIKRFYQANDRHGLFGNIRIENVFNLLPNQVPNISYYDNGTLKTSRMFELNLAGGDLPRPGDICYKFAHNYGHWMIVRGVDLETTEVVVIEQNYHDGKTFQPARRMAISSCKYFRVPW